MGARTFFTHAEIEAMVDSRRRLEDDLEFRAELERRADAGNGLAREILDAPREPRPLSREQEAALAEARVCPALHAGTLSNEEVFAVLEARWRDDPRAQSCF